MKKKFKKNIFIDKIFRREKFNLYTIYTMKKYVFDFQFKLAFAIKLKDHSLINSISINILFSSIVRRYAVYKVLKSNDYKFLFHNYKKFKDNKSYYNYVQKLKKVILNPKKYKVICFQKSSYSNYLHFDLYLDRSLQFLFSFIFLPYERFILNMFLYGDKLFLFSINFVIQSFLLKIECKKRNIKLFLYIIKLNFIKDFDIIVYKFFFFEIFTNYKNILMNWLIIGSNEINYVFKRNFSNFYLFQNYIIFFLIYNIFLGKVNFFLTSFLYFKLGDGVKRDCKILSFLNNFLFFYKKFDFIKKILLYSFRFLCLRRFSVKNQISSLVYLSSKKLSFILKNNNDKIYNLYDSFFFKDILFKIKFNYFKNFCLILFKGFKNLSFFLINFLSFLKKKLKKFIVFKNIYFFKMSFYWFLQDINKRDLSYIKNFLFFKLSLIKKNFLIIKFLIYFLNLLKVFSFKVKKKFYLIF